MKPGLCGHCLYRKIIRSDKGSEFTQCLRSFTDASYPKYPRLPVVVCGGYVPSPEATCQR
jgi:hypothetical protein